MISKIVKGIKKPKIILLHILGFKIFRVIPDPYYLKIKYRIILHQKLNLEQPKSFNEKIQWLKIYDRNPRYIQLVDKYEVRKHIINTIGEKYLIPLLGVYNSYREITFEELPSQFVLKPNHTSGDVYICTDKSKIDYKKLEKTVNKWMKKNFFWFHREWPYKNVKPRIVCEKYMVDESGFELKDYKFFCFDGEPKLIQVDFNRFNNHHRNLYTPDWVYVDAKIEVPNDVTKIIEKPKKLDEMLNIAKKLSVGIPHVRIDLYSVHDNIYFGEFTFYHASGFKKFSPETFGRELGDWIKLPEKK